MKMDSPVKVKPGSLCLRQPRSEAEPPVTSSRIGETANLSDSANSTSRPQDLRHRALEGLVDNYLDGATSPASAQGA